MGARIIKKTTNKHSYKHTITQIYKNMTNNKQWNTHKKYKNKLKQTNTHNHQQIKHNHINQHIQKHKQYINDLQNTLIK